MLLFCNVFSIQLIHYCDDYRYGEYSQLRSYVLKALTSENNTKVATILNIGCGNSNFSARLAVDGYDTTNIDFSDVVITEMQLKYPLMTYELMDMTKLSYPNSSFDVVIDKGSLDALMSDDTEDTRQQAYRMFQHIERVLTDQGAYICISLGQDYILTTLLEYFAVNSQAWTIEISLVVELVDNPLIPMVFVFKKKQTTAAVNNTGLCLNFDSLGTPLGAPVSLTVENTFTRVSHYTYIYILYIL
jgi:ubiquinone/menaquinone biosynthesis C-methylase UbiE